MLMQQPWRIWVDESLGMITLPEQDMVILCYRHIVASISMRWCWVWKGMTQNTVLCRYNTVNILWNILKSLSWNNGCLRWIPTLIYILPQSLQWCMQNHVISDCVILAPDCMIQYEDVHKCCYFWGEQSCRTRNVGLKSNLLRSGF